MSCPLEDFMSSHPFSLTRLVSSDDHPSSAPTACGAFHAAAVG